MGDPPAWHYEQVIELVFSDGQLEGEIERSGQMKEIRESHIATRKTTGDRSYPSLASEFKYPYQSEM